MKTNHDPLLAVWEQLADPRDPLTPQGGRISVLVSASAWEHIVLKHVSNPKEPWSDIFWPEMVGAILADADGGGMPVAADLEAVIQEALRTLGAHVMESFSRPMVLIASRRRWLAVLRCGALAVLADTGRRGRLLTCYVPQQAAVCRCIGERWQIVARKLVRRYATIDWHEGIVTHKPGVSFVIPSAWGFHPESRGCSGRGSFGTWDAPRPSPGVPRAAGGRRGIYRARREEATT
jgi:hypothetical protein